MFNLLKRLVLCFFVAFPGGAYPISASKPAVPVTKITKPELPWLDVPGIWSRRLKKSGNESDSDGANSGSSDGSSGSGTNGGRSSTTGTEYAKPNGGGSGERKKLSDGTPGKAVSQSSSGGSVVTHDLWWPVCAFLDQSISDQKGSEILKGMADMAAACGVTVVFWKRTVANWGPNDPTSINDKSVEKCNLPPSLAAAGSATALVPWRNTAAKMCDDYKGDTNGDGQRDENEWNEGVAGCAQLRQNTSLSDKQKKDMESNSGGQKHGTSSAKGGVAPSIESPQGWSSGVVAHEAQGHSQMGKPNGKIYGLGIGTGDPEEGEGSADEGRWSGQGCAVMRQTALPNTQKFSYDPTRLNYYTKPTDPIYYYDLMNGEKIFNSDQQFATNNSSLPLVSVAGRTAIVEDGPEKTQNPSEIQSTKPKSASAKLEDGEDGHRHKPKTVTNKLLGSLKEVVSDTERPETVNGAASPPSSEPVKAGPRLGYDESAPKGRSGKGSGGGAESVTSVESMPADIYSGDASSSPSVQSSEASGALALVSVSGGTGAGASITFDDNAPKGASGSSGGFTGRGIAAGSAEGAAGVVRVGGQARSRNSAEDELDGDEFFDGVGEDGRPLRGRRRTLRGQTARSQTERSGASVEGRALRNRREPASSQ